MWSFGRTKPLQNIFKVSEYTDNIDIPLKAKMKYILNLKRTPGLRT